MHLLPASTESPSERRIVGAAVLLLHAFLACYVLHAASQGIAARAGDAPQGNGDALVVEFIAVPAEGTSHSKRSTEPAFDWLRTQDRANNPEQAMSSADQGNPRILSEQGEYAPPDKASVASASPQPQAAAISASAAKRGAASNDLIASYHATLRAHIAQTWRSLTTRDFPSNCALRLSQSPGGMVTATSANECSLSNEDRLQLEAAALMAQPLPYAGYEAVFVPEMRLEL